MEIYKYIVKKKLQTDICSIQIEYVSFISIAKLSLSTIFVGNTESIRYYLKPTNHEILKETFQ